MGRRLSSTVFVGRGAELARIDALRASAVCGEGATVLVSGEAGIGKTRFCVEIGRRATEDGWLVLKGSCDEFGATARPFRLFRELAPALLEATAGADQGDANSAWQTMSALMSGIERVEEAAQFSRLCLTLLQHLSTSVPTILILDDLHWADESSRILFRELATGLQGTRTLTVGAYRDTEIERGHPWRAVLATLHREVRPEVIDLAPFDEAESRALAAALGAGLSPDGIGACLARTGGNVFFLEELFSSPTMDAVPRGAREVVLSRLDRLPGPARTIADAAALDTALEREGLAVVSRLPSSSFDAALDVVVESGLLVPSRDGLSYRHALLREIAYQAIPVSRRPLLHQRLAEWMEASGSSTQTTIAHHWQKTDNRDRALATTVAAARAALRAGAIPESAALFDTAFELWDGAVPPARGARLVSGDADSEPRTRRTNIAALALAAVRSYQMCRRFDRAISVLEQILEGPYELTSVERARILHRLAISYWQNSGNEDRELPRVAPTLRRAVAVLDDSASADERVIVLSDFVTTRISFFGLDTETLSVFDIAARLADGELSPSGRAAFEVASLTMSVARGETPDFERLIQLSGDPRWQWASLPDSLVRLMVLAGQHELAAAYAERIVPGLRRRGLRVNIVFGVQGQAASSLIALGRWRDAVTRFRALQEDIGEEVLEDWDSFVSTKWGALLVRTGDLPTAERYFQRASRWIVPYQMDCSMGEQALTSVEIARIQNDLGVARESVSDAVDSVRGHWMARCGEAVAFAIAMEADAAFGGGDAVVGLSLADRWIARLRSCLEGFPGRLNLCDLGMFIEQSLAERGRLSGENDVTAWEDLARRWHELPRPYHEAYCRYRAAFALLMAPSAATRKLNRERADEHLRLALATAEELGAVYLQADIEALRRSAGLRTRLQAPRVAKLSQSDETELTSREVEVLRLVVAGNSNGQIAVRLGITTKTASVHVSNILRKLNASNRVEAAVRASRSGLLEPAGR